VVTANRARLTAEWRARALEEELAQAFPEPSTLNPLPSTLNPQPSTLNPQPSTLNPQPSIRHSRSCPLPASGAETRYFVVVGETCPCNFHPSGWLRASARTCRLISLVGVKWPCLRINKPASPPQDGWVSIEEAERVRREREREVELLKARGAKLERVVEILRRECEMRGSTLGNARHGEPAVLQVFSSSSSLLSLQVLEGP